VKRRVIGLLEILQYLGHRANLVRRVAFYAQELATPGNQRVLKTAYGMVLCGTPVVQGRLLASPHTLEIRLSEITDKVGWVSSLSLTAPGTCTTGVSTPVTLIISRT
jgi:hypothetical protein